ncbi:hypothetical protein M8J77_001365 [Diaphorina citri]|nr:hypothetical protein M8J77_001365 [Diaphorina citri]
MWVEQEKERRRKEEEEEEEEEEKKKKKSRGLNSKTKTFHMNILNQDHEIIALTETWLQDNVFDTELFDDNYQIFRQDRDLTITDKETGGDWFPGWPQYGNYNKQPNDDGLSRQDCVELRRTYHLPPTVSSGVPSPRSTPTYMWNDRDCSTRNYFICETAITTNLPGKQR